MLVYMYVCGELFIRKIEPKLLFMLWSAQTLDEIHQITAQSALINDLLNSGLFCTSYCRITWQLIITTYFCAGREIGFQQ